MPKRNQAEERASIALVAYVKRQEEPPVVAKYPGGMVGGVPVFNAVNIKYVEDSNA